MIIEGSFYRLTPDNDFSLRFDLELLCDIGGKNPRKEFKNFGYSMSLEHAIHKCIQFSVSQKFEEKEIISLHQYLKEFCHAKEEIKQEINRSTE